MRKQGDAAEGCRDVPLPNAVLRGHVTAAQARGAENGTCPLTRNNQFLVLITSSIKFFSSNGEKGFAIKRSM